MQAEKTIIFIVYKGFDIQVSPTVINRYLTGIVPFYIDANDKSLDTPIDQVIAEHFINQLIENKDLTIYYKNILKCFLQRYKYGTKERTDEILKEKVYKNNK